jgi:hypothetical protein
MGLTLGASSFGYQGLGSVGGGGGSPTGYYGAFSDLTTQQFVANTITPLKLNTTDLTNGVSLQGTPQTQIKVVNTGVYNIQFSAQLNHTTGGLAVVTIWLRKNGIDIPATSTDVTIEGNNTKIVPAWNFLASASANDSFEILISATDDHCEIYFSGARTSPIRPSLPSLIVTVTQANPSAGSGGGGNNIAILNEGVVLTTAVTSIDFIGNNLHASAIGNIVSVTLDTVTPTSGGTGQTSYVTGDTLYASATNVLSKLPIGSETNVLSVVSGLPAWVDSTFLVPILIRNATNLYLLQNT